MQRPVLKYSITFLLLLIYINRGLFITPYEIENTGNKEVNSVMEWVIQLVTGESNDIDEDGDLQSDCNSVKIVSHDFYQKFAQSLELLSLHEKNIEKIRFQTKENFYRNDFYTQIDHPPQV
jgi:hypothetical protein